jgi:hypothetical protein
LYEGQFQEETGNRGTAIESITTPKPGLVLDMCITVHVPHRHDFTVKLDISELKIFKFKKYENYALVFMTDK